MVRICTNFLGWLKKYYLRHRSTIATATSLGIPPLLEYDFYRAELIINVIYYLPDVDTTAAMLWHSAAARNECVAVAVISGYRRHRHRR